ncbi:MAG: ribosome maturation factor RimP [Gaiellales bacterium]|jgi:ribosome maturation factor RimP|nr:ribosome maturation factor RimP [Gaiellales bacterium]MDX6594575.1 ribosome maturation factor RimP [Gaiellales bacterium]
MGRSEELQDKIETTLRERVPEVEVLLAEQPSPNLLRITIDRPNGTVDLELCERVSRELAPLRERFALEVSSPGIERPLVKPEHYRRFVGHTVAVRTGDPVEGRRSFRGKLTEAGDDEIELDLDGERARLPYAAIRRGNLVDEQVGGKR